MNASDSPAPPIRRLRRTELDQVIEWAAEEGWNPGLGDADAFWAADPEGFLGVESDGELIASGASVSYGGRLGFMGLFIVRPDLRGAGLGRRLWYHRRDTLLERLNDRAAIGLDGVLEMERFYADGGFRTSHHSVRMRCLGRDLPDEAELVTLAELPFDEVAAFDRDHFGAPRETFLRRWIDPEGGLGIAAREDERLVGLGIARPCREGFKIGPLFAEDEAVADRVFRSLNRIAIGKPLFLDVPEHNTAAMELARRFEMDEVFRCARMYLGRPPKIPWERIFGVTTLELG
jgi:GNAT superfamily N-acetyltransferase